MKSDIYFYKKLEEIQAILVAHDLRINERLDRIEKLIKVDEARYVSVALEQAVRKVALRAIAIDQKVSDN